MCTISLGSALCIMGGSTSMPTPSSVQDDSQQRWAKPAWPRPCYRHGLALCLGRAGPVAEGGLGNNREELERFPCLCSTFHPSPPPVFSHWFLVPCLLQNQKFFSQSFILNDWQPLNVNKLQSSIVLKSRHWYCQLLMANWGDRLCPLLKGDLTWVPFLFEFGINGAHKSLSHAPADPFSSVKYFPELPLGESSVLAYFWIWRQLYHSHGLPWFGICSTWRRETALQRSSVEPPRFSPNTNQD